MVARHGRLRPGAPAGAGAGAGPPARRRGPRRALLTLLLLAAAAACLVARAAGERFTVTSLTDDAANPAFGSLRYFILAAAASEDADSTISFNPLLSITAATVALAAPLPLGAACAPGRRLAIGGGLPGGGRATLSAAGDGRVTHGVNGTGCDLELSDLNFEGVGLALTGPDAAGGGPRLRLARCRFSGAGRPAGRALALRGGAALAADGCAFEDHSATASGGALHAAGSAVELSGCVFERNTEPAGVLPVTGGAVFVTGEAGPAALRMTNVTFRSNAASWGGALGAESARAEADGCVFEDNRATRASGGAAAVSCGGGGGGGGQGLAVRRSAFRRNRADAGGAVALWGCGGAVFEDTAFEGNRVWNVGGGAVAAVSAGGLQLLRCLLAGNSADGALGGGGGLLLLRDAAWGAACSADVRQSTFDSNTAAYAYGGSQALVWWDCALTGASLTLVGPGGAGGGGGGAAAAAGGADAPPPPRLLAPAAPGSPLAGEAAGGGAGGGPEGAPRLRRRRRRRRLLAAGSAPELIRAEGSGAAALVNSALSCGSAPACAAGAGVSLRASLLRGGWGAPSDGNLDAADPRLGDLADNGGPTRSRLPLPGGPAAGAGRVELVADATDQRGAPRVTCGAVDLGATQAGNYAPSVTPAAPAVYRAHANTPLNVTAPLGLLSPAPGGAANGTAPGGGTGALRSGLFAVESVLEPTVTLALAVPHPRVRLDGQTGAFTYRPEWGFCGRDSFQVVARAAACGGAAESDGAATVFIDVDGKPPLAPPVITAADVRARGCKRNGARVHVRRLGIAAGSLALVRRAVKRTSPRLLGAPRGVFIQIAVAASNASNATGLVPNTAVASWPEEGEDGRSKSRCHLRVPSTSLAAGRGRALRFDFCAPCRRCFEELKASCGSAFLARLKARAPDGASFEESGWSEAISFRLDCDAPGGKGCDWSR
ncbi:MAG: hypothetical protein J3K34DRAFT_524728 [Monoraphidium minutum]|nr:MAG: hypothetical protein J3K34DRAFT_524728 [Monoraphidium minutum]